jgi:hypothetical protein
MSERIGSDARATSRKNRAYKEHETGEEHGGEAVFDLREITCFQKYAKDTIPATDTIPRATPQASAGTGLSRFLVSLATRSPRWDAGDRTLWSARRMELRKIHRYIASGNHKTGACRCSNKNQGKISGGGGENGSPR